MVFARTGRGHVIEFLFQIQKAVDLILRLPCLIFFGFYLVTVRKIWDISVKCLNKFTNRL